jgi:C1A family cysteine protease
MRLIFMLLLSIGSACIAKNRVFYDANLGYDIVQIDGHRYPTGYKKPGPEVKKSIHFFPPYLGYHAGEAAPEELDYRQFAGAVFYQQCGDCWAQGAKSAFEGVVGWKDNASINISPQFIIDCSGFGSCNGGYISVDVFKKLGAVYESEYPYKGATQKCKYTGPYHQKAEATGEVNLTWSDMKRALMELGPMEVCGSASALGNGGWVEKNASGATNHCYALFGWLKGEKHGKKAGDYAIIKNSWGTGWGDKGWGYYKLSNDGETFNGDVITEAAFTDYKASCTPQAKANAGADKIIVVN